MTERRYDIDWLRVIAIFLLIIYHIAIVFQPWGVLIGFIQSDETSLGLWIPMSLINIWRIPLLFFVSGMGVAFALRRRDWKQFLGDRAKRILLPLVFGSFAIVPIHNYIFQNYYGNPLEYTANVGHLWFLANICIYISMVIGFAFLDQKYDYKFFNFFRNMLKKPFMSYLFFIPFIAEAILIDPVSYPTFVGSGHGFILGMFSFIMGWFLVAIGKQFWEAIEKTKFINLGAAFSLFLVRLLMYEIQAPNILQGIEAMFWIFAVFGLGYKYLNKPSVVLSYLSESVYPVYIIHMIYLFLGTALILPLELTLMSNFLLINLFTILASFGTFEILRRINIIRPLFGMNGKYKKHKEVKSVLQTNE